MNWISIRNTHKPPQGLKIQCFSKGDVWIAQRFIFKGEDHWLPIPYCDSLYASSESPEYWNYIIFPEAKYKGLMKVKVEEEILTIDEFYENYPEQHECFVQALLLSLQSVKKRNHLTKHKVTQELSSPLLLTRRYM